MHVSGAPVVETARRFREAVLDHGGITTEAHDEVGPACAGNVHRFGALKPLARMRDGLLQAGRGHQLLQFVGAVDDHQCPRPGFARLFEPAREQRDVQADQHVGGLDRTKRAFAAADSLDPNFGP